ncbi:TetR/AcrR family transcriptional regulator [Streptomyces prunicolor]|uniref:Helix-turn-helix domain-containing protein n=2 Tax=Streptomyces prunicolor TaxID=67348 RepID=A0ABU4FDE6_9ACTN|nr:helix-turn-helix domain-containing protein [Streptomyces prunicolor]MDV7218609.1 helix-turn-helix domain-containing protein [Streptomyces prunicolor]
MTTADRLFARRGATVPLNEIAREAGLGVGTVYRRFPDLQSLVDALFTERFTMFLHLATTAAEQPDPARALRQYLLAAARWRSEDRALEVILANASVDTGPVARTRDQLGRLVDGLAERAVTAGAVRKDFVSADVYAFLNMIGAVADRTHDVAPDAWRRYAEVLMVGFGLEGATADGTSAMTDEQLLDSWPKPLGE